MRRLACVILSCFGLTFALAGPAIAAKPVLIQPLDITSAQAVAVPDDPTHCYVQVTWTAAPQGPKGYEFERYFLAMSTNLNADWGLGGEIHLGTQVTTHNPLPNDGTTWYFNVTANYVKGKPGKLTSIIAPWGDPEPVVMSC